MKLIDLVGRVFGRLQVVARAGSTDRTPARPLWRCRCACGNVSACVDSFEVCLSRSVNWNCAVSWVCR